MISHLSPTCSHLSPTWLDMSPTLHPGCSDCFCLQFSLVCMVLRLSSTCPASVSHYTLWILPLLHLHLSPSTLWILGCSDLSCVSHFSSLVSHLTPSTRWMLWKNTNHQLNHYHQRPPPPPSTFNQPPPSNFLGFTSKLFGAKAGIIWLIQKLKHVVFFFLVSCCPNVPDETNAGVCWHHTCVGVCQTSNRSVSGTRQAYMRLSWRIFPEGGVREAWQPYQIIHQLHVQHFGSRHPCVRLSKIMMPTKNCVHMGEPRHSAT